MSPCAVVASVLLSASVLGGVALAAELVPSQLANPVCRAWPTLPLGSRDEIENMLQCCGCADDARCKQGGVNSTAATCGVAADEHVARVHLALTIFATAAAVSLVRPNP
ncbi:hypothetical protein T484DRAFT_1826686 [Baffinella frigidus]|nr:hypothetical protein T484DRAFT_1826686 [Cryptophyta sp. CCMP2293]